jgi:hypothetical protein
LEGTYQISGQKSRLLSNLFPLRNTIASKNTFKAIGTEFIVFHFI